MKSIILFFTFIVLTVSQVLPQPKITAKLIGDKIEFRVDGNLFTSYIFSESEKYPFFFPVNGPSNASVTSMRNSNYPHHSSLFFSCDKLNGGNYWQEDIERGQIISLWTKIIESGEEKAVIENECIWKRPGAEAPIKDKRLITVSVISPEKFQIDFDITMEILMDVSIGKSGHSLFSGRMDPDIAVINGGTIINAEGETGEKGTFGKRSEWIDYYGERMGETEGMAILQHPSNKWFPAPWFTRDYGFFSPTPVFMPENGKNIFLKKGEQIILRYRVIVHSGDHIHANIAEEFEKYKSE